MTLDDALATGVLDFNQGQLDVEVTLRANIDGEATDETFRVVGLAHERRTP